MPVGRVAGIFRFRLEQAQHRGPLEDAVRPAGAGLVHARGMLQHLLGRKDEFGARSHRRHLGSARARWIAPWMTYPDWLMP